MFFTLAENSNSLSSLSEFATTGFKKVERDAPDELWLVQYKKNRRPERGTDLDWYQRGEIIISPLYANGSATELIEEVEGWGIEPPVRE